MTDNKTVTYLQPVITKIGCITAAKRLTGLTELYNLTDDPLELKNLANVEKNVAKQLETRMLAYIAKREKATGRKNPMYLNVNWHGVKSQNGPFESSQQAYDTLHIGSVGAANKLQAGKRKK